MCSRGAVLTKALRALVICIGGGVNMRQFRAWQVDLDKSKVDLAQP